MWGGIPGDYPSKAMEEDTEAAPPPSNLDSRGVLRGSCQICRCEEFVKSEKPKCGRCDHPPGKHLKLTVGGATSPPSTASVSGKYWLCL